MMNKIASGVFVDERRELARKYEAKEIDSSQYAIASDDLNKRVKEEMLRTGTQQVAPEAPVQTERLTDTEELKNILSRIEALQIEIKEIKDAVRPYAALKKVKTGPSNRVLMSQWLAEGKVHSVEDLTELLRKETGEPERVCRQQALTLIHSLNNGQLGRFKDYTWNKSLFKLIKNG